MKIDESYFFYDFTPNKTLREIGKLIMKTDLAIEEKAVLVQRMYRKTLNEIGKEFGVTLERIRQIEAKATRKLKHYKRWGKVTLV